MPLAASTGISYFLLLNKYTKFRGITGTPSSYHVWR